MTVANCVHFYEYRSWLADPIPTCSTEAAGTSTGANPRLDAYIAAARRGAKVRVLLDRHFDLAGDNQSTVAYLRDIAFREGLDLEARLGDPTFLALHNKMVLARIDKRGYVHVGSINGNEMSAKGNRELALQVQNNGAYKYLAAVFDYDWGTARPPLYFPLAFRNYHWPRRAETPLISEVYYSAPPEREWVELYNATAHTVDLSGYKLGDAAAPGDPEGMTQFPANTIMQPGQLLCIAAAADGFREDHPSVQPDFEMIDTDPSVPDMREYRAWGTWKWGLNNSGDEVLLLDGENRAVDVVVYGDGSYPGVVPHAEGVWGGHSLERYPAGWDSDDCSADFRDQPLPNPDEPAADGELP